jgi:DNA-binding GntR family transcriptional regulator
MISKYTEPETLLAPGISPPPLSVVDQVTETLLSHVLEGSLAPGTEVPIQSLSALLGVSHVPVREALRRLESRGLVIFKRGRSPVIAPIAIEDFEAVFRLRALVEGDVAERSAPLFTPERLAAIRQREADFYEAVRGSGGRSAQRLHTLFHLALLPAANHWDRQVLEQLWDASERYIRLYVAHQQDGTAVDEVSISSHQVLTDAAGSAKPEQFRRLIVNHVLNATQLLRPGIAEIVQPRD